MVADLKKFLLRGNVLDLAVAVVIGAAFGLVVQSFIDNIINPIIAAIFGKPDISQVLTFTLRETDDGPAILSIGGFLQEVLNFAIIGVALFAIIQAFNKLQERRAAGEVPDEEEPAPDEQTVLLTEIRDLLRDPLVNPEEVEEVQSKGVSVGLVVGVLLGAALAMFVAQNTDETKVKWLTFEAEQPLWMILLATAAVTLVIVELVGGARRRRKRKQKK